MLPVMNLAVYAAGKPKREKAKPHINNRRSIRYRRAFGLSFKQIMALCRAQKNRCASCGDKFKISRDPEQKLPFAVDHNHATGAVRGLLCTQCNTGLGLFRDDPERLLAAVAYLARNA